MAGARLARGASTPAAPPRKTAPARRARSPAAPDRAASAARRSKCRIRHPAIRSPRHARRKAVRLTQPIDFGPGKYHVTHIFARQPGDRVVRARVFCEFQPRIAIESDGVVHGRIYVENRGITDQPNLAHVAYLIDWI